MSANWITDRRPTEEDADEYGLVWITEHGTVTPAPYIMLNEFTPWMPIKRPAPYVKPKRYLVEMHGEEWGVKRYSEIGQYELEAFHAMNIPTREAAERIAAIYEEVMP